MKCVAKKVKALSVRRYSHMAWQMPIPSSLLVPRLRTERNCWHTCQEWFLTFLHNYHVTILKGFFILLTITWVILWSSKQRSMDPFKVLYMYSYLINQFCIYSWFEKDHHKSTNNDQLNGDSLWVHTSTQFVNDDKRLICAILHNVVDFPHLKKAWEKWTVVT